MIGLCYTAFIILFTYFWHLNYYFSFLMLATGLVIYRNSLSLKSRVFGYVFLFQRKIERFDIINLLSCFLFLVFYFGKELENLSLEVVISLIPIYIFLYYWLFEGLPIKIKKS